MMSFTSIVHDSPEWHSLRSRHIGGSEVAALFDIPNEDKPSYVRSRYALWHVKAGNAPPPLVDNPRIKWGLKLEAVIAEAAAEENHWIIAKGGYVSDSLCDGLGCTLDFVIESDPAEDGPGALEIKNVDWLVHRKSWDEDPPAHILLQHQHQLAATGYTWGAVCCLVGGNDLKVYRYKARPRVIEGIRQKVREFWKSIDENREPPIDGSDSASAVVAALHPTITDDAIDMRENNEWAEAAHALWSAAAARKRINEEYDLAKNRVAQLLAGHKRGWGNGWKVNTRITPENPGRLPKPGELIGQRKESRAFVAEEMTA